MWFGNGTAPPKAKPATTDALVAGKSTSERVLALTHGAIAALPASLRRKAEAQYQHGTLPRLTEALTTWIRGTGLDPVTFASRLFGREADDPVARLLRSAAVGAATAVSRDDYQTAAGKLASAIQTVGIDHWPRFVADASARAGDPATQAIIEKSRQPPDPARDAIRPVYPIETAIGIGAAGVAEGAVAAGRAVGGAILRQFLPDRGTATTGSAAEGIAAAEKAPSQPAPAPEQNGSKTSSAPAAVEKLRISRQKQDGHIAGTPQNRNRMKQPTSTFDGSSAEADALTREAWNKGSPLPGKPTIRDYDFGRRIGTGPKGEGQSVVRVHQDQAGRIHGHPSGRKLP